MPLLHFRRFSEAALGGRWWSIELVPRAFKIIAFVLPASWRLRLAD